jgi:hypothetical protein
MPTAPAKPILYPHTTATRLTPAEKRHLARLCEISGQRPSSVLRQLLNEKRVEDMAPAPPGGGVGEPVA